MNVLQKDIDRIAERLVRTHAGDILKALQYEGSYEALQTEDQLAKLVVQLLLHTNKTLKNPGYVVQDKIKEDPDAYTEDMKESMAERALAEMPAWGGSRRKSLIAVARRLLCECDLEELHRSGLHLSWTMWQERQAAALPGPDFYKKLPGALKAFSELCYAMTADEFYKENDMEPGLAGLALFDCMVVNVADILEDDLLAMCDAMGPDEFYEAHLTTLAALTKNRIHKTDEDSPEIYADTIKSMASLFAVDIMAKEPDNTEAHEFFTGERMKNIVPETAYTVTENVASAFKAFMDTLSITDKDGHAKFDSDARHIAGFIAAHTADIIDGRYLGDEEWLPIFLTSGKASLDNDLHGYVAYHYPERYQYLLGHEDKYKSALRRISASAYHAIEERANRNAIREFYASHA